MVTRTLGVVVLVVVAAVLASCCHRTCEPPASVAVPAAAEDSDSPFIGIDKAGGRAPPEAQASARITVLDPEGSPVRAARVQVWRTKGESSDRRLQGGSAAGPPRYKSDTNGLVVLGRLAPGATYHLFVGAPRDRTDLRDAPAVEDWRPRDETVRLRRWRVIKGVVKDTDGRPVVDAAVWTKDRVDDMGRGASTDEAGRFTLERIPEGPIALEVSVPAGLMTRAIDDHSQRPVGAATVTAGDENVVLTLAVGKELFVRLEEPDGRPSVEHARGREFDALACLWLPAPGGDGALATAMTYVRHGVARFRGLRADEGYTLWITPSNEGNMVYETGVRAGERRLLRRPGKPITVNVLAPAGATDIRANVGPAGPFGDFDGASRSSPGPVEVRGVPEGTWQVSAWAKVGDDSWHGYGTATAGSCVDVEVKPDRPSR